MITLRSLLRPIGLRASIGLTATLALLGTSALAHHGWSWYGNDPFELTGRVVETHFGNPHDRLTIEADGQIWNVVLSPPRRSQRAGFDSGVVKVGDTITAYGHRHEERGNFEMKTERIVVGDATYDLYPDRL
jgi:hypothetical protein